MMSVLINGRIKQKKKVEDFVYSTLFDLMPRLKRTVYIDVNVVTKKVSWSNFRFPVWSPFEVTQENFYVVSNKNVYLIGPTPKPGYDFASEYSRNLVFEKKKYD